MLLGTPIGTPVNGPNFINTVFSDLGVGFLGPTGVAPYTGTFKPSPNLAGNTFASITPTAANSANVNGTWDIHVLDHVNSGFTGVFNNATLTITYSSGNYSWASVPAGFTSVVQNPPAIFPTITTTYTVTLSSGGCIGTSPVTVNVSTAPTVGAQTATTCSGTAFSSYS